MKNSNNKKSEIVRKGYNKIAEKYDKQRSLYKSKSPLSRFIHRLPKNSKVLDLGCGAGVPASKFLADKGYNVTGIDFSDRMLKLSRKNVPNAKFLKMDITKIRFNKNSFDGAVSFYAIIHVPRENHKRIYRSLHKAIRANGVILVNAGGTKHWEGYDNDYMGVKMFWSSYAPEMELKIIEDSGFKVIWKSVLKLGGEKQFWALAKNIKSGK